MNFDLADLRAFVEAGLGIAAVPRLAMPPRNSSQLVSVALVKPLVSRTVGL
jgi:DNA-binding transcriptional LysR family regulator